MENKIKVAIADFPPLIISEGGRYKGFEIDFWEAIAKEINIDFEYEKHNFKEIIPLLAEGKVDMGLAGITINEGREIIIDFSHSTLNSGLLISVNKNRNKPKFFQTIRIIFNEGKKIIKLVAFGFLAFIFIFGNLLWLAEKNANTFSKNYFPGIFESFWLTIISMTTVGYGDYVPHTWLGRAIIIGIIIMGFSIFGLFIAQITAFLTVIKVRGEINNSRDLVDKRVATVEGSTSENILKKIGAKVINVPNIEEAYNKLKNEDIDAVVFDAPAVIYYKENDKDNQIDIVGELFDKQRYGIALRDRSPFREKINRAVLKLRESGQYGLFYRKWFGKDLIMEM